MYKLIKDNRYISPSSFISFTSASSGRLLIFFKFTVRKLHAAKICMNIAFLLFLAFGCVSVCMQQIIANMKGGVPSCLQKLPFSINHLFGQIRWNWNNLVSTHATSKFSSGKGSKNILVWYKRVPPSKLYFYVQL